MQKTAVVIVDSFHERYLLQSDLINLSTGNYVLYVLPPCNSILEIEGIKGRIFGRYEPNFLTRAIIYGFTWTSKVATSTMSLKSKAHSHRKLLFLKFLGRFKFLLRYTVNYRQAKLALKEDNVSRVLLSTPFQKVQDLPFGLAARSMKLRVECYVYSWDNLTAKGPLLFKLDKLYVWNKFMLDDGIKYHDLDKSDIEVIGVPTYRKVFFNHLAKERRRRTFSGFKKFVLVATVPENYYGLGHVNLVKVISGYVKPDRCVVIRPHPMDKIDYSFLKSHNVFIDEYWEGERGSLETFKFGGDSIEQYFSLLESAEMVISVGSSVTVDASIVGTYAINLGFSLDENFTDEKILSYYSYTHYKPIMGYTFSNLVLKLDDLLNILNKDYPKYLGNELARDFGGPYNLKYEDSHN